MSGGTFDGKQYIIDEIAYDITEELDRQGKPKPKKELFSSNEYYERHPEECFYITHREDVQKAMMDAVKALRIAAVYAQRVDYYLAEDDSEDSFISRLQDELEIINSQFANHKY